MLTRLLDSTGVRPITALVLVAAGALAACGGSSQIHAHNSSAQNSRRQIGVLMRGTVQLQPKFASLNLRLPAHAFLANSFFTHAATATRPTITTFFAASTATISPLKRPAFAASPPATSAAMP